MRVPSGSHARELYTGLAQRDFRPQNVGVFLGCLECVKRAISAIFHRLTPVAGLNLLTEKVSRFSELSSEFEF